MEARTRWFSFSKLGVTAVLVGVAYALVASFTTPFTIGADLVTALALGLAAVALAVRIRSRRSLPTTSESSGSDGQAAEWAPTVSKTNATKRATVVDRWSLVWLGMAGLVLGWELFAYSQTPRHAYPTLSSLIDMVDASHVGRTVMFALWLLLGCYLVLQ